MTDWSADEPFRRGLEAFGGVTFQGGNSVTRLKNGDSIFPAMLEAVATAEHRIDFVTFVYWTGDIAQKMAGALCERARAGVTVRVLLDAVGASSMSRDLVSKMDESGVHIAWFRPVVRWKVWETDHRTHRKILVVDDDIAFTGGVGIAEEWEGDGRHPGEWRDSHFEIRGPAVDALRSTFIADWRDANRPMFDEWIPARPSFSGDMTVGVVDASAQIELNPAGRSFETILQLARHRLWISTPYFNPSRRMSRLLSEAAGRGVEVRVMIPGEHIDKRVSLIAAEDQALPLMEAGVHLHRYRPTMLHLKQLVADDSLVLVGSVNMNERSLYKDEEVAVAVFDRDLNAQLADDFLEDLSDSDTVTDPATLNGSFGEKLVARLLRPFHSEM